MERWNGDRLLAARVRERVLDRIPGMMVLTGGEGMGSSLSKGDGDAPSSAAKVQFCGKKRKWTGAIGIIIVGR
jgi:hypothetical protein